MVRPVDALLEFLRAEEARGVTHVHLDEEAKELLRGLHRRAKAGPPPAKSEPTPARTSISTASVSSRPAEEPAYDEEPAPTYDPAAAYQESPQRPQPVQTPEGEAPKMPAFQPDVIAATSGNAAQQIAELAARAEKSPAARKLGTLRETMVFSAGNPEAELMLIGEAPGYHEERQREPFVGPAGQKLNDILKAMGLQRPEIYISNIVKFRPAIPGQTTNNRKPTPEEMATCMPYIRAEVGIVKPKCIVALGGTAAEGLLGLSGSVGAMRGKWHEFEGIPVRVTYHPAYLLHGTAGQDDKRKIWEDMLAVMAQLGLPISDKQRGYFLPKA